MRYAHSLGSMSSAKMDGKLKSPLDYINIVLQIIEHILSWSGPEKEETVKMPYLVIDSSKKTKRAYIVKDNQIVSFSFPFQVYEILDSSTGLRNWYVRYNNIDVNSTILSKSRSLYSDYDAYKDTKSFREVASAQNLSDSDVQTAIRLFEALMLTEPAYVRYDYDSKCAKGLKHPLCHFDFNYIVSAHYKVGLHGCIDLSQVEDMVCKDTDCWYLAKYKESLHEKQSRLKERFGKISKRSGKKRQRARRKRK